MTKERFIREKNRIANALFGLARELEELQGEARTKWEEATDECDESYWEEAENEIEDQVSNLDDIYSSLHEKEDEEDLDEEYMLSDEELEEAFKEE